MSMLNDAVRDCVNRWFYEGLIVPAALGGQSLARRRSTVEASWSLSGQAQRQQQLQMLQRLIAHARRHVPWYRKAYAGLSEHFPRRLEDMDMLPLLGREDLQADPMAFVSELVLRQGITTNSTGGSSGMPTPFAVCRRQAVNEWTTRSVVDRLAGLRPGMRVACLWGARKDHGSRKQRLTRWLANTVVMDCYSASDGDFDRYHQLCQHWRPNIMVCYAGAAAAMARRLEELDVKPDYPRTAIICTAETLKIDDRRLIERVFGKPVQNRYGCRELGAMAAQCKHQGGLHTLPGAHFIETIDPQTLTRCEGSGELIVTSLLNFDVPWIRYRIGDVGHLTDARSCRCGRTSPMLLEVSGRTLDYLVAADGRWVHGTALNKFFWPIRAVQGYQIEQLSPTRLVVRIQGMGVTSGELDGLGAAIRSVLGAGCDVSFDRVERIECSASGKRRFVINRCLRRGSEAHAC